MDREDQNAQHERVEKLWQTLDTRKEGQLSLQSLKKGLGSMDHRKYCGDFCCELADHASALKNADSLLEDVLKAIDTDRDGYIQYSGMLEYFFLV